MHKNMHKTNFLLTTSTVSKLKQPSGIFFFRVGIFMEYLTNIRVYPGLLHRDVQKNGNQTA